MHQPLVSILIPNYNKALYLRETLESVLSQTYANWECIIVDDHSTDNSWDILSEYAKMNSRIKIYKRPSTRPKGGSVARNYAFELSVGEYIQWLDSDDVIHKNKILEQTTLLLSSNIDTVSISNWDFFDSSSDIEELLKSDFNNSNVKSRWDQYPKVGIDLILWLYKQRSFIPTHAYFMSRNLILKSGLWLEDLNKNQDGEFMVRVLLKSSHVVFCNSILAFYRRPNSKHLSKQNTLQSYKDWFRSLELGDKEILSIGDSLDVRKTLIIRYEHLIRNTGLEFSEVTENSLKRIKILYPKVKFDISKSYLIWISSWIGFQNFMIFRDLLLRLKFLKN